jgi:mono/diheme cytochrome c family protein
MPNLARAFWIASLSALPLSSAALAQAPGNDAAETKVLYDKQCRSCHGTKGVPAAAMKRLMPALPVLDKTFLEKRTDEAIVAVLKDGKGTMKPFADKLTAEQMAALARYIRKLSTEAATGGP